MSGSFEGGETVERWLVSDRGLLREEGKWVERSVAVGIVGARISEVFPAEELRSGERRDSAERRGEEIIDVGARPLCPSFVNGHTHLALAPLRGIASLQMRSKNVVVDTFFRFEKYLTAEDVRVFSRLGAFESALFGVGQVWDHYYFGQEVALALSEVGLGGVVAPTLQDLSGPGAQRSEEELDATRAIVADRSLFERGVLGALGPHASDTVSDALFERAGDVARELGVPLHMHLYQSSQEARAGRERFRKGAARELLSMLGGASLLLAHGLYLSDEQVQQFVRAKSVLAYCPYSQLQFGFLGPISAWLEAGGGWTLGTDCVASNDALDVQRELPLVGGDAALRASFGKARKKMSATADPKLFSEIETKRRALLIERADTETDGLLDGLFGVHLSALSGVPAGIARGGWAHLLVFDSDHPCFYPGDDLPRTLAYGSTSGAIVFSVMAGQIRGRSDGMTRELLGSPLYADTLTEARRRRDELLARVRTTAAPSTS